MSASPGRRARRRARQAQPDADLYVRGFKAGYSEGYARCLADLSAANVVARVAVRIIAFRHDPIEQARYVLEQARQALAVGDVETFQKAVDRATAEHLLRQSMSRQGGT